jgi:hypothetical protein
MLLLPAREMHKNKRNSNKQWKYDRLIFSHFFAAWCFANLSGFVLLGATFD